MCSSHSDTNWSIALHTAANVQDLVLRPQVHIAYVEIYNEAGYDLLDPAREGTVASLADLPRVGVLEDDDGRLHMRNLSLHRAGSEEEALNLVSRRADACRRCHAQACKMSLRIRNSLHC